MAGRASISQPGSIPHKKTADQQLPSWQGCRLCRASCEEYPPEQSAEYQAQRLDESPNARLDKPGLLEKRPLHNERPGAGEHGAHATDATGQHEEQGRTGADQQSADEVMGPSKREQGTYLVHLFLSIRGEV